MVDIESVRRLALSFPETDEHPHFERKAFRVKKKIFATLLEKDRTLNVMLSPVDQSVFCSFDRTIMYPVAGSWGLKGATTINLEKVKKSMLKDAMTTAYCKAAPPKLAAKFMRRE